MSQLLLQVVIVVAFGAFCFGCGYLTAFIVTRNQWRDEMIKRGVARYNWQTRRTVPIRRSAYPFCQGDLGEIGRSRIPMALSRDVKTCP